jgi:transposase-like protein
MAETTTRRQWTAEDKLKIIQEARQADQTVSDVCRRHGIAVGQFYQWEKQATHGALTALRQAKRGPKPASAEVVLQTEVQRLRTVVTELSAENLQLKKGILL